MVKITRKGAGETLRVNVRRNPDGSDFVFLTAPVFDDMDFVTHLMATRLGGASGGVFATMNLSFTRGDDPEHVMENYRRIAGVLGTDPGHIVATQQTHTVHVRKVTAEDAGKGVTRERDYTDVDGLVTDVPGLALAVYYADCVPLFFVDPVHRAIGASHSGWRGTVGRMGQVTADRMRAEYGTRPENLICVIGTSICRDCYEVSEDVADAFRAEFGEAAGRMMDDKGGGKYQLDLWEANRTVLLGAGVLPEHITMPDICTKCNPGLLFSHRVNGEGRGNLAAFLMLRE